MENPGQNQQNEEESEKSRVAIFSKNLVRVRTAGMMSRISRVGVVRMNPRQNWLGYGK